MIYGELIYRGLDLSKIHSVLCYFSSQGLTWIIFVKLIDVGALYYNADTLLTISCLVAKPNLIPLIVPGNISNDVPSSISIHQSWKRKNKK